MSMTRREKEASRPTRAIETFLGFHLIVCLSPSSQDISVQRTCACILGGACTRCLYR
ncbi:hypothetical protein CSUI_000482 [Cystoisospora suis]|uniref:Uncharacterized protein n=1 Tax=Cystoisospora suis TaxID=483139 RepID=A0A2C6LG29_9APIC|nr:hypothetical protein CSUI_000482 [Cystoisospora suis]